MLPDSSDFWAITRSISESDTIVIDMPEISSEVKDYKKHKCIKGNSSQKKGGSGKSNIPDKSGMLEKEERAGIKEFWRSKAAEALHEAKLKSKKKGGKGCSNEVALLERIVKGMKPAVIDWRKILNEFIQEEICDYSFTPPDRRFSDCDFFLPDFNDKEYVSKELLFMVDTSGSVNDEELAKVYSEIQGALEQFDGKINGYLGFFDAMVEPPKPFSSIDDLKRIIPYGGGGTDFYCIFDYVRDNMIHSLPACIIVFTDGMAAFPEEESAMGVPVLWIISNEMVTPPWGKSIVLLDGKKDGHTVYD